MQKIIDTHFHIFDLNQFRVLWLEQEEILNRPILLSEFEELRTGKEYEVIGGVHIELDTIVEQKAMENQYFEQLAKDRKDFIKGTILYADMLDIHMKETIQQYAASEGVKGIRYILHVDEAKPGTCLEPIFVDNMKKLGELGLHFEACLRSIELDDLYQLGLQCPDTKIVLNHMGLPDVTAWKDTSRIKEVELWKVGIQKLATLPQVTCKMSGLSSVNIEEIKPLVEWCIEQFGIDRVMFASNFPVCNLSISFPTWTEAMMDILAEYTEEERNQFFYKNALKIYRAKEEAQ